MATLEKKPAPGGYYFSIDLGKAVDLGEKIPNGTTRTSAGGFAVVVARGNRRMAAEVQATNEVAAESKAMNRGTGQPPGTQLILGRAVGELDGRKVFRGVSEFVVRRG